MSKHYRRVDELGRISLPVDIRKQLNILPRDELVIYEANNKVIIEAQINNINYKNIIKNVIRLHYGNEYHDVLIRQELINAIERSMLEEINKYMDLD